MNRPPYAADSVRDAAFAATASRAQMFAMPVATRIREVAASSNPAWLNASRPYASPNHRVPQPCSSSSAAICPAAAGATASRLAVQIPTRPSPASSTTVIRGR